MMTIKNNDIDYIYIVPRMWVFLVKQHLKLPHIDAFVLLRKKLNFTFWNVRLFRKVYFECFRQFSCSFIPYLAFLSGCGDDKQSKKDYENKSVIIQKGKPR